MSSFDARDLTFKLDKVRLKALYQTRPQRHTFDLVLDWAIMLGTITLVNLFFHPLLYVLAVIIVGARMHAMAILMHDATHYRFLKNRKWNDLLTNIFTMYPVFTSIEVYRKNHLSHHQHLNTEDDPDWVAKLGKREFTFPKTKTEFWMTTLSYFTLIQGIRDAIWFLKRFGGKDKSSAEASKAGGRQKLIFYISLAIVLSVFGLWKIFLFYWVVPYLSTFFMFQYIRSVAEHFGDLAYDHLLTSTRTIKTNWMERFFLAPHNVSYHLEHHLYPGVPYYHLPQLHDLLMEHTEFQEKAHITRGYLSGLMKEMGDTNRRQAEAKHTPLAGAA
ncbi:MAG: fatty acid desaturase family protein [Bacteroidota bacterium]